MEHLFTDANFDAEVLQSSVPVLVDFWAPWCGPCRMTSPIIEELSKEIDEGKLKIGKCNVDENGDIAMKYGIMSIPNFVIFKGGQIDQQFVGGMLKEGFLQKLQKYLV